MCGPLRLASRSTSPVASSVLVRESLSMRFFPWLGFRCLAQGPRPKVLLQCLPVFPPGESASLDALGVNVIQEADFLGELAVKPTAMGLGGRLNAASTGHAAAVLVGIYFSELMLDGKTVAQIHSDNFWPSLLRYY